MVYNIQTGNDNDLLAQTCDYCEKAIVHQPDGEYDGEKWVDWSLWVSADPDDDDPTFCPEAPDPQVWRGGHPHPLKFDRHEPRL